MNRSYTGLVPGLRQHGVGTVALGRKGSSHVLEEISSSSDPRLSCGLHPASPGERTARRWVLPGRFHLGTDLEIHSPLRQPTGGSAPKNRGGYRSQWRRFRCGNRSQRLPGNLRGRRRSQRERSFPRHRTRWVQCGGSPTQPGYGTQRRQLTAPPSPGPALAQWVGTRPGPYRPFPRWRNAPCPT